jgi:hypothetical protein
MKKGVKKLLLVVLLFVISVCVLAWLRDYLIERERIAELKAAERGNSNYIPFAENVPENDKLRKLFQERHPEYEIILACTEDITNDGVRDLVVIFRHADGIGEITLYTEGGIPEYKETSLIKAPKENQKIRFFNMDKLGAIEVLITGEKHGQVGYAVYRVMDGEMVDLYGEGMEDCC